MNNSKAIIDNQNKYADYIKNAQTMSIEAVSNVVEKAKQHADEMGPDERFATICTVTAVLIAGYQIIQHLRHFNEPQVQL